MACNSSRHVSQEMLGCHSQVTTQPTVTLKNVRFMEKVSLKTLLRRLAIAIFTALSLLGLGSCNADDEPDCGIDYYFSIQPRCRIYRRGGLPPAPKEDMIGKLTTQMRTRIREVYPVRDQKGNDAAVLVICDEIYRSYLESGLKSNTECVATLYRARMEGTIVRQSTKLKTYVF